MLTMEKEQKPATAGKDRHAFEHSAIIRELLDHVGDDLAIKVTRQLSESPARFCDLKQFIDGISQRKLTLALRQLIKNGLALRKHSETFPSRVEYSLTPLGFKFLEQVQELVQWVDDHRTEIQSARDRFERSAYTWVRVPRALI